MLGRMGLPDRVERRKHASNLRTDAAIETQRIAVTLGQEARASRRRRRRTQASVAEAVGISRSRYAELERGDGAMAPLDSWIRVGLALGRPVAVTMTRDPGPPAPEDAGHLVAQEWVIARSRRHGRTADFELPVREGPASPVADVAVRDDAARVIEIVEIWNRLSDLGAATRSADRKLGEAAVLGALAGGDARPYRVSLCWLLIDSAANRALVAGYPAVLAARFPGSSLALVRALRSGGPFPDRPAIAWFDPRIGDVRPVRLRRRRSERRPATRRA